MIKTTSFFRRRAFFYHASCPVPYPPVEPQQAASIPRPSHHCRPFWPVVFVGYMLHGRSRPVQQQHTDGRDAVTQRASCTPGRQQGDPSPGDPALQTSTAATQSPSPGSGRQAQLSHRSAGPHCDTITLVSEERDRIGLGVTVGRTVLEQTRSRLDLPI